MCFSQPRDGTDARSETQSRRDDDLLRTETAQRCSTDTCGPLLHVATGLFTASFAEASKFSIAARITRIDSRHRGGEGVGSKESLLRKNQSYFYGRANVYLRISVYLQLNARSAAITRRNDDLIPSDDLFKSAAARTNRPKIKVSMANLTSDARSSREDGVESRGPNKTSPDTVINGPTPMRERGPHTMLERASTCPRNKFAVRVIFAKRRAHRDNLFAEYGGIDYRRYDARLVCLSASSE
jgi:hypothetical protein